MELWRPSNCPESDQSVIAPNSFMDNSPLCPLNKYKRKVNTSESRRNRFVYDRCVKYFYNTEKCLIYARANVIFCDIVFSKLIYLTVFFVLQYLNCGACQVCLFKCGGAHFYDVQQ